MGQTEIAQKLKQLRKNKRLHQTQVADLLGLTQGFYSRVENGVHPITEDQMKILIDNFNLPEDYFYSNTANNTYSGPGAYNKQFSGIDSGTLSRILSFFEKEAENISVLKTENSNLAESVKIMAETQRIAEVNMRDLIVTIKEMVAGASKKVARKAG